MSATVQSAGRPAPANAAQTGTVFAILLCVSFSHMLNDMMQSLLPAVYPLLRERFALDFSQIGIIALAFQLTASILQPLVGIVTDRRPMPYSLSVGMGFTLIGLIVLAYAGSFPMLVAGAAGVGLGSSVFHPDSSRVARMASGGRHGLAQSIFQLGGNAGAAIGPLLAAFIVLRNGQASIAWFSAAALLAMLVLAYVGRWYANTMRPGAGARRPAPAPMPVSRRGAAGAIAVLLALMFSKFFYTASMNAYLTFYLMDRFHVPTRTAQLHLFVFLASMAAGTMIGGPIGDRIGRKPVIWGSILGVLPFTLMLPHANLFWSGVLTVPIGLILSSAFSAIVVYAQELVPGKTGTVSGLFFGFAFGMGGLGAAVLGVLADATSIETVYSLCAFLPAIGLLAAFLPDVEKRRAQAA